MHTVVVMSATQMVKTVFIENALGCRMASEPDRRLVALAPVPLQLLPFRMILRGQLGVDLA